MTSIRSDVLIASVPQGLTEYASIQSQAVPCGTLSAASPI